MHLVLSIEDLSSANAENKETVLIGIGDEGILGALAVNGISFGKRFWRIPGIQGINFWSLLRSLINGTSWMRMGGNAYIKLRDRAYGQQTSD